MKKRKFNLISISIILIFLFTFNSFSTNIPSNGSGASGYSNQYDSGGGTWAINPISLRAPMSIFELYDQNGGEAKSKILVCQYQQMAELLTSGEFKGVSYPYKNHPHAQSIGINDKVDELFKAFLTAVSSGKSKIDDVTIKDIENASYKLNTWRAEMTYKVNLPAGVTVVYTDAAFPCYTGGAGSAALTFNKFLMPVDSRAIGWEDWKNAWLRGDTTGFHAFLDSLKTSNGTAFTGFIEGLGASSASDFITLTPDSTGAGNTNPQGKFAVKDATNNTCPIILFKTVDMFIDSDSILGCTKNYQQKEFTVSGKKITYIYNTSPTNIFFYPNHNKPLVTSNMQDPNPFIKTILNKLFLGAYNPDCGSLVAWMTGSDGGGGGGGGGGETTPTTPTIKPPDPIVEYADEMILFEDELQYNYSLFDGQGSDNGNNYGQVPLIGKNEIRINGSVSSHGTNGCGCGGNDCTNLIIFSGINLTFKHTLLDTNDAANFIHIGPTSENPDRAVTLKTVDQLNSISDETNVITNITVKEGTSQGTVVPYIAGDEKSKTKGWYLNINQLLEGFRSTKVDTRTLYPWQSYDSTESENIINDMKDIEVVVGNEKSIESVGSNQKTSQYYLNKYNGEAGTNATKLVTLIQDNSKHRGKFQENFKMTYNGALDRYQSDPCNNSYTPGGSECPCGKDCTPPGCSDGECTAVMTLTVDMSVINDLYQNKGVSFTQYYEIGYENFASEVAPNPSRNLKETDGGGSSTSSGMIIDGKFIPNTSIGADAAASTDANENTSYMDLDESTAILTKVRGSGSGNSASNPNERVNLQDEDETWMEVFERRSIEYGFDYSDNYNTIPKKGKKVKEYGITSGYNILDIGDYSFYPYIRMRYKKLTDTSKYNFAYIISNKKSHFEGSVVVTAALANPEAYTLGTETVWDGWTKTMNGLNDTGILEANGDDRNVVAHGGSTMFLYTRGATNGVPGADINERNSVEESNLGVEAFITAVPDGLEDHFINYEFTVNKAGSALEEMVMDIKKNLEHYRLEKWVAEGIYRQGEEMAFEDNAKKYMDNLFLNTIIEIGRIMRYNIYVYIYYKKFLNMV